MKNYLKALPYLVINAVAFYLFPILIKDTGSAMVIMLIGIPVLCFGAAVVFGVKNSFKWYYPAAVALLFVPTIFIFYNSTAWVYIIAYGLIALAGNYIGKLFFKPPE
jgi:hypothetical protein